MPQLSFFAKELRDFLSEETCKWVLPALRQDPLIWESLQDLDLVSQAKSLIGSDPYRWTPANLALVSLGYDDSTENIIDHPTLSGEIDQTIRSIEKSRIQAPPHSSLAQAGLIALAQLKRTQENGNLTEYPSMVMRSPKLYHRPALACLYGFSSDRFSLLQTLADHGLKEKYNYHLVIHVLLSNPHPLDEQENIISSLISNRNLSNAYYLIKNLNIHRPDLATQIASRFLSTFSISKNGHPGSNITEYIEYLSDLMLLAEINTIANQSPNSIKLHSEAFHIVDQLMAEINTHIAESAIDNGDIESALSSWQDVGERHSTSTKDISSISPEITIALLEAGHPEEALALLPEPDVQAISKAHPAQLLAAAQVALAEGNTDQATSFATQAYKNFKEWTKKIESDDSPQMSYSRLYTKINQSLVRLLSNLSLNPMNMDATTAALSINPNDIDLLKINLQASRASGALPQAVEAAYIAVALSPKDVYIRWELISTLEEAEDWEAAYKERMHLLDERFSTSSDIKWPPKNDLYGLARASLMVNQPQQTVEICQSLLEEDSQDGHAHAIIGEAFMLIGQTEDGEKHLNYATQFSPHDASSWLSLARAQENSGRSEKALETLKTASHAVPTDPAIQVWLAEKYLAQEQYSQALPFLQLAYDLIRNKTEENANRSIKNSFTANHQIAPQISFLLGETLQQLGHDQEAYQVLCEAYAKYPAYNGLAYCYAKSLLKLEKYKSAIPPLVVAVKATPMDLEPNLDYARTLIRVKTHPQDAVRVLTKLSDISPENLEVKALLAEAYLLNSDMEDAMSTFSKLFESALFEDREWKSRISHGFGRTALALEKTDLAIAALQEALRDDSQNPEIFRTLAESYARGNLPLEALEASRSAIQLAPDDVEMLLWYAHFVRELNEPEEAIPVLTRAHQLSPDQATFIVQLGEVQALIGNNNAAIDSYRKILQIKNPPVDDLLKAAEGLSELGDINGAINCLELGNNELSESNVNLLSQLASAYKTSGQFEKSLTTLDKAIVLENDTVDLLLEKTEVLLMLRRPQAAEGALEHAINLYPTSPDLHQRMAILMRSSGEPVKALGKAEELVALCRMNGNDSKLLAAQALAAELALTLLQSEYASEIIEDRSITEDQPIKVNQNIRSVEPDHSHLTMDALPYFCFKAELALQENDEITAAKCLTQAINLSENHQRVLALQARLAERSGDHHFAHQTLKKILGDNRLNPFNDSQTSHASELQNISIETTGKKYHEQVSIFQAIAEACRDLKYWDEYLYLTKIITDIAPNEPLAYLNCAQALVTRAEYQHFCESLNAINNVPGNVALSKDTYLTFTTFLDLSQHHFKEASQERKLKDPELIQKWQARGNAIFNSNSSDIHNLDAYSHNPDDLSALISTAIKNNNLDTINRVYKSLVDGSDLYSQPTCVLTRLAQALTIHGRRNEDFTQALEIIQTVIRQYPNEPLFYALLAEIYLRINDHENAYQSILTALNSWPDEPRWHAMAAMIQQSENHYAGAISHFKKAIELEPTYLQHYLSLGECLQKTGDFRKAIETLENAHEVAPDKIEPLIGLARAYLEIGEYKKAEIYAQSAIQHAPQDVSPLLISAEIALHAGNLREAQKYIKNVLQINPDQTDALHLHARILSAQGQDDEALNTIEHAVKIAANPLPLMLEKVKLITALEGINEGLSNLYKLEAEYPNDPTVLHALAQLLAENGQIDAAISYSQKALKSNTSKLSSKEMSQIHHLIGHLLRQSGQLDQAIYHLNNALQMTPSYIEPYLDLGKAYQDRRQHAISLQTYQKAISIAPDDPRPYYQAGQLLKDGRDYQGAESMLRRAADLAPEDLTIHRQLGALVALNIVHNRRAVPKV